MYHLDAFLCGTKILIILDNLIVYLNRNSHFITLKIHSIYILLTRSIISCLNGTAEDVSDYLNNQRLIRVSFSVGSKVWSHLCDLVKLAEEFVQRVDKFARRAVTGQPGESHDVGI